MSKISHVLTKGDVVADTRKAMNLIDWSNYVDGQKVFIKVNYMSDQVIPGLCTSPWVLEGVLQELRDAKKKVIIGDADLATNKQLDRAVKNWGILDICKKYNARFINLSNEECRLIKTQIPDVVPFIPIPQIILNCDNVITIPVAKTHYLTRLTCSLKNQWGTIPRFRQQYHPVADVLIPEINRVLDIDLTVIDATICMEGEGPRTGIPKVVNSIFVSPDLVAADKCIQDLMGLKGSVNHIEVASKTIPNSNLTYNIIGDKLEKTTFIEAKKTIVTKFEDIFRKIPVLNTILFKTDIFAIPARLATEYNTFYYFRKHGIRYRNWILNQAPQYRLLYTRLPGFSPS